MIYEADPESGLRKKSDIVEFVGQKIFNKALISPDGGWVLLSAKDPSAYRRFSIMDRSQGWEFRANDNR